MSKQFFVIGANLMFWQGGFDSRPVNFYVKVGNSFAPHINTPGGNGGLHVSCSLFWDRGGSRIAALCHYTIYRFVCMACLSICMKSAWKIEWNALFCTQYRRNIFISMQASEHQSIIALVSLCSICNAPTPTHIDDIRFESEKEKLASNTCTVYMCGKFWKMTDGCQIIDRSGMRTSDFLWRYFV